VNPSRGFSCAADTLIVRSIRRFAQGMPTELAAKTKSLCQMPRLEETDRRTSTSS
jgi:hypothetical protein